MASQAYNYLLIPPLRNIINNRTIYRNKRFYHNQHGTTNLTLHGKVDNKLLVDPDTLWSQKITAVTWWSFWHLCLFFMTWPQNEPMTLTLSSKADTLQVSNSILQYCDTRSPMPQINTRAMTDDPSSVSS